MQGWQGGRRRLSSTFVCALIIDATSAQRVSGCRHTPFQALRISGTAFQALRNPTAGRQISGHVFLPGSQTRVGGGYYFSCPPEFSGLGSRRGLPAPRRLDRSPSRIGVSGSATLPGWVEMKVKCGKCWGGRQRINPGDDARCLGHATGTLRPALPRASSRRLRPRVLCLDLALARPRADGRGELADTLFRG